MVDHEIEACLREAEQALAAGAAYEVVIAALDRAASMTAAHEYRVGLAEHRLTAVLVYERTEQECEQALARYLDVQDELWKRAVYTMAVCREHPPVAHRRLEPLIEELEAAESSEAVRRALRSAYRIAAELGGQLR
ncbi:hypothetical protein [Haliangium sp.]|uniref:hypothetical protein n=1 Tax=Haliangium sp. TaxID=2663208 RepID=UPI003D0D606E